METMIQRLIADSMELELPRLTRRRGEIAEIPDGASVLVGMRRTGKTYRMFQKMHALIESGVPRNRILYLNFEDERLADITADMLGGIDEAYFRAFPPERGEISYYFFDEIQYVAGWERFVRRVLDRRDVRFFLSVSSSRLLSREVATAMRGRAVETRVFPFSFAEFLDARGIAIPGDLRMVGRKHRAVCENAFAEYLSIGGFPAALNLSALDRQQVLQGYVNTVVLRDVVERHGVTSIPVLRYLTRRLMTSSAGHFSVNKFYNDLKSQGMKCGKDTLHEYLQHLEDAFLFSCVFLDTPSERRRMVNPRKVYTADHGLVWACLPPGSAWGTGHALENLVLTELLRRRYEPAYGITSEGHEVDFVVRAHSGERRLIQVCAEASDPKTREREIRALLTARDPARRLILTLHHEDVFESGGHVIELAPTWKWLLDESDGGR